MAFRRTKPLRAGRLYTNFHTLDRAPIAGYVPAIDMAIIGEWRWFDDFLQDTRFALRTFGHSPGFALTAVVTLALGIGVNIGMFSLVNGLLLRPLYERPDEVVGVYGRSTTPSGGYRGFSYPNYVDLREGTADIFANLAAYSTVFAGLDVGDGTRRTLASAVTANYFQTFGLPLALGRPFIAEEERIGADIRVAIISYPLWQRRGADPGMIGRSIRVNGEQFTSSVWLRRDSPGRASPGRRSGCRLARTIRSEGSAGRRRARGARVGRRRAAPRRRLDRDPRSRARHRFASARAGVSGGERRLHARDVDAFASHVHARSRKRRGHRGSRPAADGHAGDRPARGMPEPRQSAAGPGSGAPAGDGDQVVTRRRPRAPHPAAASPKGCSSRWPEAPSGCSLSTWATSALLASVRPVLPVALSLPEFDLDWRVFAGTVGFSLAATLLFGAWPAWALTGRAAATDLKRHAGEEGRRRSGGVRVGNGLVDRPGRALASPARVRWAVPDERDLGGDGRSRVSSRRGIARGSRSGPGGVRRSERESNRISPWWIDCKRSPAWKR